MHLRRRNVCRIGVLGQSRQASSKLSGTSRSSQPTVLDSQAPEPLKVYVVAENRLYREAVTEVLASRRGLMVVGQSAPQEMRGDELR